MTATECEMVTHESPANSLTLDMTPMFVRVLRLSHYLNTDATNTVFLLPPLCMLIVQRPHLFY